LAKPQPLNIIDLKEFDGRANGLKQNIVCSINGINLNKIGF
jgi:hypothetical protein